MKKTTCLYGGPVFDGDILHESGCILFDANGIIAVMPTRNSLPADKTIDVRGKMMIPGLVDLHSDALEKCIEMRPGIHFDAEFALMGLDRRLATCGITTFCHAICFADNELGLRESEEAARLVQLILRVRKRKTMSVRHLVHGRYEIGARKAAQILAELMSSQHLDLLSIMDHTPGQGQFKTFQSFFNYYSVTYKMTSAEIEAMVDRKKQLQAKGWSLINELAQNAKTADVPLLSHDDDTLDKVQFIHQLGAAGSEFPVTLEAVTAAKELGMKIFMGAPNLMRDASSNDHLKASDTVERGLCDGLLSDYYPESLLQSPFIASHRSSIDLADTLKLVTSRPGRLLNSQRPPGTLKPGSPADLVVLDTTSNWVQVSQTWVAGRCVYQTTLEAS